CGTACSSGTGAGGERHQGLASRAGARGKLLRSVGLPGPGSLPPLSVLLLMAIHCVKHPTGIHQRSAGVEGYGNSKRFGNLFLAGALLQCRFGMDRDAAITPSGYRDCQCNQLPRFAVEMTRLLPRAGKRLISLQGIGAQLAHFADPSDDFVTIFDPVQHASSPFPICPAYLQEAYVSCHRMSLSPSPHAGTIVVL